MTPYGQKVDIDLLSRLWIKITSASELHDRREAVDKWNQKNHVCKRGIAAVPIKMGIGDPEMNNNQASVCVQVFLDGSVRVKMGAVDVGDGLLLRTKKQVSDLLGVAETRVDVCGSEEGDSALSLKPYVVDIQALIFGAVKDACGQLNDRLGKYEGQEESRKTSFGDRVTEAGGKGENLTALGFFKLAGKGWDSDRFHGSPFSEYFYGGAVVEVEVDALSGEVQVLRADLFCAGAETECAELDRAQISRSYMMGQGWMLSEDVNLHPYAIPGIEEAPIDFRIEMTGVESAGKKAPRCVSCAEAPVALGIATRYALKDAIFAYAPETRSDVDLPVPAGPDATMRAIRDISRESSILKRERKKSGEKG